MNLKSEGNGRSLAKDKMDKISRTLSNAKDSIDVEGIFITKEMEELVRRRLIGEPSEVQFLKKHYYYPKKHIQFN